MGLEHIEDNEEDMPSWEDQDDLDLDDLGDDDETY
jgi:hypothetical protein